MSEDTIVAGLLVEREGYLRTGREDRARQVDEQLRLRGYVEPEPDPVEEAAEETPAPEPEQPEPVEEKRTTAESRPRRRA